MPYLAPDWHVFVLAAPVLLLLAVALRRRRPGVATAARELAIICLLFTLWQLARISTLPDTGPALANGRWVWHLERTLHLPSEIALQQAVLPHPALVHLADLYYLYGHFNGMGLFLIWLFWRHRARYAELRTTVVLFTAASLVVQLVPVAPPRMLPGFVDTALRYGESVYGPATVGFADQVSAMPSVHVGWAVLVAYGVVRASDSRWRWLVLAHPVLTTYGVVASANHFWLDGIAAAALVVLAVAVQRAATPVLRAALARAMPARRAVAPVRPAPLDAPANR